MRSWYSLILILVFFASTAAIALPLSSVDEMLAMSPSSLRPACDGFMKTGCQKQSREIEAALQFCRIRKNLHHCDQFASAHSELKDLIISCEPKTFCEQQAGPLLGEAKACVKSLWASSTEMVVTAGEKIAGAWDRARTDLQQRVLAAKACDLSLACKRNLVRNLPVYNRMGDTDLVAFPALTLMTEAAQADLERGSHPKPFSASGRAPSQPTLTPEQSDKLMDLWNMAELTVEAKYHQYGCYTPEAMAELKCYVVGQFIDPTIVAGGVWKLSKAERIARALYTEGKELAATSFIRNNLYYSPTKAAQNREWMSLAATTKPGAGVKFFDVENSVMKEMNDSLKDKNLVTSLTNFHKRLLNSKTQDAVKQMQADYPGLEVLAYSDFKASRFAFKGRGPPDLEARMAKVLEDTNREFAATVRSQKLTVEGASPENWFRGGFGETADQATLASRYSRGLDQNSLQGFSSPELQSSLTASLQKAEGLRTELRTELAGTPMLDTTLHPDAFDILIKNSDDVGKAQSALKNRFGLSELAPATVQKMKDYVSVVNGFSPGIHIADRQVANLDHANFGGLSADMAGMGSNNQRATADALHQSRNLKEALLKTREAEQQVTKDFIAQQTKFREITSEVVGADRIKTVCSGDDCVAVPLQTLSDLEKQRILEKLSAAGYASKFRLSFVPKDIEKAEWRNQLSVHGESIEKLLRKNLSTKMDPNKLKGVIFGVDMKTTKLNDGGVKLLTATHPDVRLTASEQKLIEENFKLALQQMKANYYLWRP